MSIDRDMGEAFGSNTASRWIDNTKGEATIQRFGRSFVKASDKAAVLADRIFRYMSNRENLATIEISQVSPANLRDLGTGKLDYIALRLESGLLNSDIRTEEGFKRIDVDSSKLSKIFQEGGSFITAIPTSSVLVSISLRRDSVEEWLFKDTNRVTKLLG